MEKFIVSMKHYDNLGGKVTDSITANDIETAKRVFHKWVETDKKEWNTELLGNDLKFKQTEKTYNAKCFVDFGLAYTTITIRKKRTEHKIAKWVATPQNYGEMTCECGNNSTEEGFYPCDTNGNEIEPTAENNWKSLYVCGRCGKIYQDTTDWGNFKL